VWWRGQRRCPRATGVAASDSARLDRDIIVRVETGNVAHDSQPGHGTQQLRDRHAGPTRRIFWIQK
jgi:hypothetical protein